MRAPRFWMTERMGWRAALLMPAAMAYSAVAGRRFRQRPRWRADIPVFCVGNPTVCGAGKTPVAQLVAARLAAMGRQPVFLTRGYGGRCTEPTVVDPGRDVAAQVGDESLLLAAQAPTVVAPDRIAGAKHARTLGDVIVMDDGFQNPSLAKDLSILVVDTEAGLGNALPLPAGPLRLPLRTQLDRAHAVILMGEGDRAGDVESAADRLGRPVLHALLSAEADVASRLLGRPVIAFAGIGLPEKFFSTLRRVGARLVECRAFGDHHPYSEREAAELLALSERYDAMLVTTEKDMMRLEGGAGSLARLAAESIMLPVSVVPQAASAAALDALLARTLDRHAARAQRA
jgi:tetraacyldisaccharide 4'-kinase